jgi:lambda family phage portal protein
MSTLAREITIAGKQITVPVTWMDDLVNFIDPIKGAQRYQQRVRMAVAGGYTGADRTRRANQLGRVSERDADTAILPDLSTLREESQHLYRNNAIAGGAIRTNITKVVGTGLKVKAQIDREVLKIDDATADAWERMAEREFRLAAETREIDAERQLPFSLLQALVFSKALEDGDLFINLPRITRAGSPYKTKLQLIEAARICNPDNKPPTARLSGGVEKDENGAPVAYHVLNQHPGSIRRTGTDKLTWSKLPAFSSNGSPLCLHLLDKTRPGQTRGVPYLTPVVELIKQLGRYTDAEVMAAVVSGMLTVFVTNETGNPQLGPAATQSNPTGDASLQADTTGMELGYGSVIGLLPGEKVESVNPGRPNPAFDPFVTSILRQIGMSLELPFELLVKHFTASYSAARAALEEAWDYFNRRRHWLVSQFCQPVYEAIITEAVINGRLNAPGFFADPLVRKAWLGSCWIGDAPSQLDPLKEVNAAAKRVELTISTLDEESRKLTGTPWEDKLPQILKERSILRANGITISAYEAAAEKAEPEPEADQPDTETE